MKTLFINHTSNKQNGTLVDQDFVIDKCRSPYKATKTDAPLITHSCAMNKSKNAIAHENKMGVLSVDIDDGHYRSINAVDEAVQGMGITNYVIYTTGSHNPAEAKFKYRVIIWLVDYITCPQFTMTQLALSKIFNSDSVVSRIQQILYLPVETAEYEYIDRLSENKFDIEKCTPLVEQIKIVNDERLEAEEKREQEIKQLLAQRKARQQSKAKGESKLISVFDLVKEQFTVEELLHQYGFKKKGRRYLHPNSGSGLAGVMVLDGQYYSHHSIETDPLSDGHAHSAFDLIMEFEYNGDKAKTIEGLSNELMVGDKTLAQYNKDVKHDVYKEEMERHNREMHENLKAIELQAFELAEKKAMDAYYGSDEIDIPDNVEAYTVGTEEYQARIEQENANQATVVNANAEAIQCLNKNAVELDIDSDEVLNFDVRGNTLMPTKEFEFDLTKPSGIVERIISDICIKMHRDDPALAIGSALYIAMRAGLPTIENSRFNPNYDMSKYGVGLNGFKIYLNVLMIGLSASGKDKPQELLEASLKDLGEESYGRIASDKDLMNNMINSFGSCCSIIDEAGGLFSNMANSSNDYMKSLAGAMMQFATARHKSFDGLTKRSTASEYITELNRLKRSLDNIDEENEQKRQAVEDAINKAIVETEWKIDACQNGIVMPQFSILATSTPTDMEGVINLKALNTGQLSRYLLFCGKLEVDAIKSKVEGIDYGQLEEKTRDELRWIKNNAHLAGDYSLQKTAVNTCLYIEKWFESRRNHTDYAVMYRRGYEMVMRIVSILAVQDRIVSKKMLEWAFCLVRANIESFIMTCATQSETQTPMSKVAIRILNTVKSSTDGAYGSQIKKNMANKTLWKDQIHLFDQAVDYLAQNGFITVDGKKLLFTGKNSID